MNQIAAVAIAIDGAHNVWVANNESLEDDGSSSITEFSNSGTPLSPANGFVGGGMSLATSIAIDNSGNVWIGDDGTCCSISELSNSGAPISPTNPTSGNFTNGETGGASGIALDASGNIWTSNFGSSVSEYSNSGAPISPSGGYPLTLSASQEPRAIAVDGAGNVWIADDTSNSIVKLTPSGSLLSSPVGYTNEYIIRPTDIAVDGSGNVWVTESQEDGVAELVGAATPVITPVSAGVKNHAVGTRP